MRKFHLIAFMLAALVCSGLASCQKSQHPQALQPGYTQGPASLSLSQGEAKLELLKGFTYIDTATSQKLLSASHNPVPPNMLGIVVDNQAKVDWYAMIAYKGIGHIDDTGASDILKDSNQLLESFKDRMRDSYAAMPLGSSPMPTVLGWYKPPMYNQQTHTLTMAVIFQEVGESDQTVNFTTVVLGRFGGMAYAIIGHKNDAAYIASKLEQLNPCIHFAPGRDYASWQPADGSSDLAFTGLVTGGAAVVAAAKTGLLAKIGSFFLAFLLALKKAIIVVIAAIVGFIRWIGSKKKRPIPEAVVSNNERPTDV